MHLIIHKHFLTYFLSEGAQNIWDKHPQCSLATSQNILSLLSVFWTLITFESGSFELYCSDACAQGPICGCHSVLATGSQTFSFGFVVVVSLHLINSL